MFNYSKPFLLCVDDDPDILQQLKVFLQDRYNIIMAFNGAEAVQALNRIKPDLILLDVMMPDQDGYQVCSDLQEDKETAWIPVIFISALGDEQDRAKAFAAGGVDYLVKPINRQTVRELVEGHLRTGKKWRQTQEMAEVKPPVQTFSGPVQDYLCTYFGLEGERKSRLSKSSDKEIYDVAASLGLNGIDVAKAVAKFKDVEFIDFINPDSIQLGALPAPFSRANNVVVIKYQGTKTLVLSNPFDMMLQDSLSAVLDPDILDNIAITDPDNISMLFEKEPAPYITDRLITLMVYNSAQELRIDAGELEYSIQMKAGGQPRKIVDLRRETGFKLVSRFKVLAGIAAADKDRGFDGVYTHVAGGKSCYLRLSLSRIDWGDSLNIRVLEIS